MGRRNVHPLIIRLRSAREAQGFSRRTIAHKTGLSVHAIEGWEWGDRSPVLDNLIAYAAALGMELDLAPLKEVAA
ncbi:helix-turn-helix domain-containing protein [Bacillus mobilis]